MYNPYFNNLNYPQSYPQFPQQEKPQSIQNIINAQSPVNTSSEFFMAKFVKPNENIGNIYINGKTAFIDLQNKKLIIKEPQKEEVEQYEIVIPKDEKDIKIEQQDMQINDLQNQINELKEMLQNDKSNNKSDGITTASAESTSTNANAKKLRTK